jgi:Sulfotransferase domain
VLPNLVIIGAGKCGTSSLHHYLDAHPSVWMSRHKELDFFQDVDCLERVEEYERHFPEPAPVRGEASPGYSGFPRVRGVPERMRALIPDARLIYLVRDPIERTVSHYVQAYRVRAESRDFEEAFLDLDGVRNKYLCYSRYATQFDRYLLSFPAEQLLVLDGDDLLRDRAAALKRVFDFAGVDPNFRSPRFDEVLNTRVEQRRLGPGSARVARVAARLGGPRAPTGVRRRLGRLAGRRVERPVVAPALRARLEEALAPEAKRLRELTGQAFPGWSV